MDVATLGSRIGLGMTVGIASPLPLPMLLGQDIQCSNTMLVPIIHVETLHLEGATCCFSLFGLFWCRLSSLELLEVFSFDLDST